MPEPTTSLRQRVGRRLGLTPYYRITEQNSERLVLESWPQANRQGGSKIIAVGVGIVLVATLILGSGITASIQGSGFGVAAISAGIAGLLVSFAMRRLIGGYAVFTTQNRIEVDTNEQTLLFTQSSRTGQPRSQSLRFAQIEEVRLRRRPLIIGNLLRKMHEVVALELVVGKEIWVVDSAAQDSDLQAVAVALHEMIG